MANYSKLGLAFVLSLWTSAAFAQLVPSDRVLCRDTSSPNPGQVEFCSLTQGLGFDGSRNITNTLTGDVDGAASANDLDEAAVEAELESVLDLSDLQGSLTLAGDVDGAHGANDLDELAVETELEAVLDLADLQGDLALGTQTSGDYVATVADGTGIDGTATGEGSTYTPSFDATELSALTWSAGGSASFDWTFNLSGTDPVLSFSSGALGLTGAFTASTDVTATAGDVTSGDDVIVGDDVNLIEGASLNWDAGDCVLAQTGNSLDTTGCTISIASLETIDLGTDTAGNYVAAVADGTGIDGTCASEGCTYTPTFDVTEVESDIESAIDTLANLTSIQGFSFTLSNNATISDADKGDITVSSSFTNWQIDSGVVGSTELTDSDISEVDLKAVDAAGDEECLTYESTVGDFEWQSCGGAGGLPADPDVDAVLAWDDTEGAANWFTVHTGLDLNLTDSRLELDLTELNTVVFGSGTFTTLSFNAGATDPLFTFGSNSLAVTNAATITFGGTLDLSGVTTATLSASGANLLIEGTIAKKVGTQTLWIPAGSMTPHASLGATPGTTTFNGIATRTLSYSNSADSYAYFYVTFPKSWDEGTITFEPFWTAASGSGTIDWELACRFLRNDDAMGSVVFGTPVASNDTLIATTDMHIGPTSSAHTIGGTAGENAYVDCQVARDVSDGTHAAAALLLGVKVYYTDNAANDN